MTVWEKWKGLARRAATFQARVLLTLFYYTLVVPFALATKAVGDPLRLSRERGGRWSPTGASNPRSQA